MVGPTTTGNKIALSMAGGGAEGAIYEIGAVRALDEAIEGLDFNELFMYVGISAGAFICSCLANGLTTAQMCRAIIKHDPGEHPFVPENFFAPAVGELLRGSIKVPKLLFQGLVEFATNPQEKGLFASMTRLARALPVGLFRNEPIRDYLETVFGMHGRTDDFRNLRRPLHVVATDLDSGKTVVFGTPGYDHIPISQAVQASTALPGLYPPVEIEGRHYVDGVLLKTVHASVALDEGADMVLCINPLVPVDTIRSVEMGVMRRGKLADRGLPTVLAQTFRTIIHSRIGAGLATYESRYADRDVLVFEPRRDDYQMFFSNVFSFNKRKAVCEHAYRSTRIKLWQNRRRIQPILERHGLRLRTEILEDPDRDLWETVSLRTTRSHLRSPIARRLDRTLDKISALVDGTHPGHAR